MTSKKWITCTLLLAAGTLACLLAACHNAYQADTAAGAADSADAPASVSSALQALPPADAPRALRDSMPAGTLPSLDEEVWVITRRVASEMASAERDDIPGSGSMMTETTAADGATSRIPLPLAHTDVAANIEAYIASVTVDQQFHNPFEETIEAVYVFPLPQNAGINGFVMTIGDRRIRGIIRDRAEAEAIYAEARAQGHRASLLTQERPNIFTQKVANLEPGKRIDVEITYFHTLQYDDGWYEYVFPMVVGPRFNPPAFTEGIGAVARGGATTSRQPTNVEYLAPNERSGHDIDLSVAITGLGVQEVVSPTHDINVLSEHSQTTEISLARHDRVPNRDFVLRYRVAGDTVQANLLAHAGERGGHFTLVLHPPAEIRQTHRAPIEMVFVIDCSGSMRGRPIEQARNAVGAALGMLRPGDSFQIIRFSNESSSLGPAPLEATPANIRRGRRYVKDLGPGGGTMMLRGIEAALDFPHDSRERQRYVTFMTDGFIGNEARIVAAINDKLGPSRIFSFGVGSSPNRYLLARMAKVGNGAVAYLGLDDDASAVMGAFVTRIAHPAMADLEVDWGDAIVSDVYPERLPDLFVGRPVVITGRYDGAAPPAATIAGTVDGYRVETVVEAGSAEAVSEESIASALPAVWARMKIADLADRGALGDRADVSGMIREVALEYGIMSAYTAFIAVDASSPVDDPGTTSVPVAVPVPRGVRHETTVGVTGG